MKHAVGVAVSAIVLGGVIWAATLVLISRGTGNPRDTVTSEQRVQAIAQLERNAAQHRERRRWLERIERREASFAEAACVYERRKWWDEAEHTCDETFDSRLPARTRP